MKSAKTSHNQTSAKQASRAVLELAAVLSSGKWCRTSYLGHAAGSYARPEIAWRAGRGNINYGRRLIVNNKLLLWERAGRVEKRENGRFVEWRLVNGEWALPYLNVLIEILREQAKNHSRLPVRKRQTLDRIKRDREILRLRGEGLTQTQIADRLGCHQSSVSLVLKADRGRL